jgi:hypothetical protein
MDPQDRFYRASMNLDDYATFFDHEWARVFLDNADKYGLSDSAMNLCEAWKSAANNARLPWLMVTSMATLAASFQQRKPYSVDFTAAVADHLGRGLTPPLTLNQMLSVRAIAQKLDEDMVRTMNEQPAAIDSNSIWRELIETSEFGISILASQRLALAALYYGYEDFVLSCYTAKEGISEFSEYRINSKFPVELTSTFGSTLAHEIWSSEGVAIARKVRHAIAHNGGRITSELRKMQHGYEIIDDRIQITAAHTRTTFELLKPLATKLLHATGT